MKLELLIIASIAAAGLFTANHLYGGGLGLIFVWCLSRLLVVGVHDLWLWLTHGPKFIRRGNLKLTAAQEKALMEGVKRWHAEATE